jgi:hypothetical protein
MMASSLALVLALATLGFASADSQGLLTAAGLRCWGLNSNNGPSGQVNGLS